MSVAFIVLDSDLTVKNNTLFTALRRRLTKVIWVKRSLFLRTIFNNILFNYQSAIFLKFLESG